MKNSPFLQPEEEKNSGQNQQPINQLRQIIGYISGIEEDEQYLAQNFELLTFEHGKIIADLTEIYPKNGQNGSILPYFYLICQGQVRLVSFNQAKQREVSVNLLKEGDVFGGDSFWNEIIWPYKAIAAGTVLTSSVQVAKISLGKLKPYLDKLPKLQNQWQTVAKQRQALIFFKTCTELGELSSRRLQQLLPYVKEKQIAAGENLAGIGTKEPSHFWLCQGQIQPQSLNIGSSWGYPTKIPPDWVAESELHLYQILSSDWDKAKAIAPMLDPTSETASVPIAKPSPIPP
ncbi:MAG: peptidase C39, partial [Crocosphaera sp.]